MESVDIVLYCPNCRVILEAKEGVYACPRCGLKIQNKEGILVDTGVEQEEDKDFYDHIYSGDLGKKWFQGLNRNSSLKRILEKISLSYRRERFFKKHIVGKNNKILDIACGAGRDYLGDYGTVVGVDLSYEALKIANQSYDMLIQSGVKKLPFPDNTFDYVVSSDFFGHVKNEDKDQILKEIYRVLKPEGKTLHMIETDSTNGWFIFAHRYPELFKKYFIIKIGGHIGLEMPTAAVDRWKKQGFDIVKAEKIWGLIWPIQDYAYLFDNEYQEESAGVKLLVKISKYISRVKFLQVGINIVLNPINWVVEKITAFDKGQGVLLAAKKPENR